ncbi:F-box/WD repeat-containing protein pof10 [Beauveria bassiana D1-5]|uniref:F-box/WD repeat-containing protein pof10 n=1 Tax=Beauveria bassiana D1-5 TaxID=1245745 RepID=A0A0A2VPU7_BEABA|nr:F-box/WD repeat-containing protein pof10 [Beauveria bassiana D1-5]
MPREPLATSESSTSPENVPASSSSLKHGSFHHEPIGLYRVHSAASSSSRSASSCPPRDLVDDGVDVDQLDEKLRGLRLRNAKGSRHNKLFASAPGQRIADYENALTPPTPKQALGFKVIKRSAGEPGGTRLTDIPNEILTNILSHLHPDSHGAVALVSKRFYVLATTPHIWRLAFLRYFPGHSSLDEKFVKASADLWSEPSSDIVRSETRYFGRLTPLATWRSEYVFRTRLIRSLGKGKPNTAAGAIGSSMRTRQLGKKSSAVLTYNSKLPWLITNIHAVFDNGKKAPRAIQGAGALGVATMSDPTTGKIESWGLKDSHSSAQIEEVTPGLEPYGLGDGPASTDNSMDVSQLYGIIAGEGFPGGRAYFRSVNEIAGRYLGSEPGTEEQRPDIPRVPDIIEAISSVWIAKSSAVPATTAAMCGMLTGSTLGVVTAYSLGSDPSGPRYAYGDMTARWVLSPGVPIVSIKVDDNYTVRRRLSARVWAVALNALGEVFYLTETPKPVSSQHSTGNAFANAWLAGRSAYWHLVEETRRSARPDELDLNAVRGTYSPRTSCNAMNLSDDQVAAETKEIENFMRYQPNHFLDVCLGWDMQRKLEVDFANDDGQEAGEGIFVIDCGHGRKACVTRFCRSNTALRPLAPGGAKPAPAIPLSLFGQAGIQNTPEPQSPKSPPPTPYSPKAPSALTDEWRAVSFQLKGSDSSILTASALDNSTFAVLTLGEDVLHTANESLVLGSTDGARHAQEIPGRRARFLVVGTSSGSVLVWNAREIRPEIVKPCRVIQTESPSISCVAASALYLVHGGSDGLVQAWDHLASTSEPIRTLNARSNGRVPRYMMTMNPTLTVANYTAAGAIVLDSDPTILRGVVAFGAFMRYWSYSSKGSAPGRKRRLRHPDAQGRAAGRRFGNNVSGYILEEEEELRHENEHRAREQSRLHKRFGVGALGDLTEQEALEYMQMVSEESFLADETRRASDSAADTTGADTASTSSHSTADATTPEASFIESSSLQQNLTTDDEDGYEEQIQQAIRLSLLEGVNDRCQSPQRSSPDEFEFPITYKAKIKGGKKKNGGSRRQSSSTTTSTSISSPRVLPAVTDKMACVADSSSATEHAPPHSAAVVDADLALALCIQEEEEQAHSRRRAREPFSEASQDFPPLAAGQSTSKGKGVTRW